VTAAGGGVADERQGRKATTTERNAMAARALWSGQLRVSLVSMAVDLYSATQPGARIGFRQIHEPSGKRIRYEKVVPGIGPVDKDEIMKGYEIDKDQYVLLEPEEIDAVKLESKRTFELVQFVDACEIPPLYYDKPYYLVPADELAEDAYRVVREALRHAGKIGLGQITLRGREYIGAVRDCGDGLLMETLHYPDEIRKADPLFAGLADDKVPEDLLEVATALIDRKSGPFDASAFKDNYTIAMRELIDRKRKTRKKIVEEEEERPATDDNVIDLMAALKKSLEGAAADGNGRKKAKAKSRPSRTKASGGKGRKKRA